MIFDLEKEIVKEARSYIHLSTKLIALQPEDCESRQAYADQASRLNLLTREARNRLAKAVERYENVGR